MFCHRKAKSEPGKINDPASDLSRYCALVWAVPCFDSLLQLGVLVLACGDGEDGKG